MQCAILEINNHHIWSCVIFGFHNTYQVKSQGRELHRPIWTHPNFSCLIKICQYAIMQTPYWAYLRLHLTNLSHLMFRLITQKASFCLLALIDSEATENFIDYETMQKLHTTLTTSFKIKTINRDLIGNGIITLCNKPLMLQASVLLMVSTHKPIILGSHTSHVLLLIRFSFMLSNRPSFKNTDPDIHFL